VLSARKLRNPPVHGQFDRVVAGPELTADSSDRVAAFESCARRRFFCNALHPTAPTITPSVVVRATGGVPRLLNREKPHGGTPYWSHDGRWIYYSSRDTGARQIWRIPAEGGKAVLVRRNGGYMPVDSPDSKTLYYLKDGRGTGELFRSGADGSGETGLVTGIAYDGFAVAADRIYYLHQPAIGPIEIREFLLATGSDSRVATIDRPLTGGLALSPDGKSLLFSEWRGRGSLMLVDNLH